MQDGHPLAFFSKKLGPRLMGSFAYLRELCAVVEVTPEQQHYLWKLLGYHFSIEYKAGTENSAADALSRRLENPYPSLLAAIFAQRYDFLDALRKENETCLDFHELQQQLLDGTLVNSNYSIRDGDIPVQFYPLPEVLVQWSHSSLEDATWEDLQTFSQLYKVPDLEDKIIFKGGGSTLAAHMRKVEHYVDLVRFSILGEGGYGSVYKGKLRSGHLVAIKILGKTKTNGQELMNEVATIGRIHHVNVMNPNDRPSMNKVREMLEGELESLKMPPKPFLCPKESPVEGAKAGEESNSKSLSTTSYDSDEITSLNEN
ncbi:hypothetical protein FEM48_Zijuj03G0085400 [Ziziphus jujuba var. spinosa]|uniref:Serine-threonine/tyrosine-protein kinase catalytic domain-containing protein n=1 Tax=Ziziphus jujuba var. spinosa TaxID=714518 RepID=A0A978VP96_ZIZJJ|nr:hypothetical protein FEM48_Zijuj03G0085400 [Ziziphus jujuba var. spinosa]